MRNEWIEPGPPPPLAPRLREASGVKEPRVTVIMPTYRRARHIGLTIASILSQTYRDFELLVRDDGPGDDGAEEAVLAAAAGDARVRYHRNPKQLRMPGNLNDGIQEARGELIAICHDHDLFAPRYLETLVGLLDRYPTALYAHCGIEYVDQSGAPIGRVCVDDWPPLTPGSVFMGTLLRDFHCKVCALTLTRREAHERHGLYHPAYGFIADVEMWMRLAEKGDVAYAPGPLVKLRTREDEHEVTIDPWPPLATVFAIHRRYVPRHYSGVDGLARMIAVAARADMTVVRELLAGIKHGRWPSFGASADKMRGTAGPIGRQLAALLPK